MTIKKPLVLIQEKKSCPGGKGRLWSITEESSGSVEAKAIASKS